MTILITGGNGYLARNLTPLFKNVGHTVLSPSHSELDLLNCYEVYDYFNQNRIDAVIHTAIKGGKRTKKDSFEEVYTPNIQMFEHLVSAMESEYIPLIIFGSGAEFDKRTDICKIKESTIFNRWPIDPYGLSKNIISRRSLDLKNVYILRLFGCFNYDEEENRFIKKSISNLNNGLPIEIHKDMEMDFFYLDDVFIVTNYILNHDGPRNINLVYDEKHTLSSISRIIQKHTIGYYPSYKLNEAGMGNSYTGDGSVLSCLPIYEKLIGLEEGICRTIDKLWKK